MTNEEFFKLMETREKGEMSYFLEDVDANSLGHSVVIPASITSNVIVNSGLKYMPNESVNTPTIVVEGEAKWDEECQLTLAA